MGVFRRIIGSKRPICSARRYDRTLESKIDQLFEDRGRMTNRVQRVVEVACASDARLALAVIAKPSCLDDRRRADPRERIARFPASGEINRKVADAPATIKRVQEHYQSAARSVDFTDGVSMELDRWRFNLRASNTEPLIRLNVESRGDIALMEERTAELLESNESLRREIEGHERTEEVLRKYFDGNFSGHITLSKDGFGFRTDCALHLDSGITLEADSNAPDAYASADQALFMIEKRLRRYKSRLKDRSARKAAAEAAAFAVLDAPSYVIEAPGEGEEDVAGYSPVIIAEATTALKRFSVSEAVMELDLTGAPCLVFQHGSSGRVNIIYRRADGNVGWVDPPTVKP